VPSKGTIALAAVRVLPGPARAKSVACAGLQQLPFQFVTHVTHLYATTATPDFGLPAIPPFGLTSRAQLGLVLCISRLTKHCVKPQKGRETG
jgi:hypothetical protein